jgi:hypothetical protein
MTENEASRTLVKSPPELWAECSDASLLARHLGQFGDIRITRLEPETAVAWEGEDVSGTVRLEPSGWGTRVILTVRGPEARAAKLVRVPDLEPEPEPPPQPEPTPPPAAVEAPAVEAPVAEEPVAEEPLREAPPEVPVKLGFFARLFGRRRPVVDEVEPAAPEPAAVEPGPKLTAAVPEPGPEPRPIALAPEPEPEPAGDATAALSAALDSLGQAHHRPFSRS